MKIGIITFHRVYNYGSTLQAYALNRFLRDEGHAVLTIDYAQQMQEERHKKIYIENNRGLNLIRNFQIFLYRKKIYESKRKFDEFTKKNIPLTKIMYQFSELQKLNDEFDMFICGSDQIWNPNDFGFDIAYLLAFVKEKSRCISYAASLGVSSIDDTQSKLFCKYLKGYKKILVREKQGADIIEKSTNISAEVVLDPVFLLEKNQWRKLIKEKEFKQKYILCYFIGDIPGMRDMAEKLKKVVGLKIVVIKMNLRDWCNFYKKEYQTGPEDFLMLIKNAEYIFTNSFHAVAFSLIFDKKFWAYGNEFKETGAQSRISNILEMVDLSDRYISEKSQGICWTKEIDYEKVRLILNEKIKESKGMLLGALGEKKNENL